MKKVTAHSLASAAHQPRSMANSWTIPGSNYDLVDGRPTALPYANTDPQSFLASS
jgi:hypothetical protein